MWLFLHFAEAAQAAQEVGPEWLLNHKAWLNLLCSYLIRLNLLWLNTDGSSTL